MYVLLIGSPRPIVGSHPFGGVNLNLTLHRCKKVKNFESLSGSGKRLRLVNFLNLSFTHGGTSFIDVWVGRAVDTSCEWTKQSLVSRLLVRTRRTTPNEGRTPYGYSEIPPCPLKPFVQRTVHEQSQSSPRFSNHGKKFFSHSFFCVRSSFPSDIGLE